MNKKYTYPLIAIATVFCAYYFRERFGYMMMYNTYFYCLLGGLLAVIAWSSMGEIRYRTPQLVAMNFHGSVKGDPYQIGDFVMFPVGSADALGFSMEGGQGTFIALKSTMIKLNPNWVSTVTVQEWTLDELPVPIVSMIESNKGMFKPPYFVGWNIDSRLLPVNKEDDYFKAIDSLKITLQNVDMVLNQSNKFLKYQFDSVSKVADVGSALMQKANRRSLFEQLTRKDRSRAEDEQR
jgi:hypothetical protein